MKKRKQIIQLLLIAGLLFGSVSTCGGFPSAGTLKDADGNVYNTVKIGHQVWIVENLKTTKYNDGTPIPNVTDDNEWESLTSGAYCNYDNLESNADIYGRLYNWYAVNTGKLAPAGWHVPTFDDWTILENYLRANDYHYGGTKYNLMNAKSLSSKTNWALSSEAGTPGAAPENNNSTGFTALPGGYRGNGGGAFFGVRKMGYWWWTSLVSTYSLEANYRGYWYLDYNFPTLRNSRSGKNMGYSVRLVRNSIKDDDVTTTEVTAVTQTSATSGGKISSEGGAIVLNRGVCWSTKHAPTIADNKTSDGTGVGGFTTAISGLTPNTTYYVRAYATNSAGTEYGSEMSFTTLEANVFNPNITYGSMTDIDGNTYKTVTIGTQTWMAENLKVTKYNNGKAIPNVTDKDTWKTLKSGAYCNYNNDSSNVATYGRLYNSYAVNTGKLAPVGWHVPTDDDWTILEKYLIANGYNYNGTITGNYIAKAMASSNCWESDKRLEGTIGNNKYHEKQNESGFTALPSGQRSGENGSFYNIRRYGYWWSTTYTENKNYSWIRYMMYDYGNLNRSSYNKNSGLSVRCVQNSIIDDYKLLNSSTDFNKIENGFERAAFIGGIPELFKFISKTLVYPEYSKRIGIQGTMQGTFYVNFTIDTDGSIINVKIPFGIDQDLKDELIRIFSIMPNWKPGRYEGNLVRTNYRLPINFKLE